MNFGVEFIKASWQHCSMIQAMVQNSLSLKNCKLFLIHERCYPWIFMSVEMFWWDVLSEGSAGLKKTVCIWWTVVVISCTTREICSFTLAFWWLGWNNCWTAVCSTRQGETYLVISISFEYLKFLSFYSSCDANYPVCKNQANLYFFKISQAIFVIF